MKAKRRIVVGVTGSIACYKAAEVVSKLAQSGYRVDVVMTRAAQEFVRPLTFETLSRNRVVTDLFESKVEHDPEHVALAAAADIVLVAPASANIIGKIAAGIADDALSTLIMAARCPILIAPAMNDAMYENPVVQRNIDDLKKLGYLFVEPEKGYLACGREGVGRLAPLESILGALEAALKNRKKARRP
ncbi:MAG: bifunctional phosphopantothenoylcysteine decarboxylase/phosphopantothenate--cysteine ligase CoaBC [Planctomycetota bacterium]|nr:bifunctional phosphopantothenoylcysteine decarboxylase/phosphopantothenate--cysteine ligase CoaBC [Planctomycetota bacterium]